MRVVPTIMGILVAGGALAQSVTLNGVRADVSAAIREPDDPTWQVQQASATGVNSAAKSIQFINNFPFEHGGKANAEIVVTTQPTWPIFHALFTTNAIASAQDGLSIVRDGRATTRLTLNFTTTGYHLIRISVQHRGYLLQYGASNDHDWSRRFLINGVPVWSSTGTQYDGPFETTTEPITRVLAPGAYSISNETSISSFGVDGVLGNLGRYWHTHQSFQNITQTTLPPSTMWLEPLLENSVDPESYQVLGGTYFGGDLSSLFESDSVQLYVLNDETDSQGWLDIRTTTDRFGYGAGLMIELSSSRADQTFFADLWNYDTQSFEPVGFGAVTLSDQRQAYRVFSNFVRFIEPTGGMRARIRFVPTQDLEVSDGWTNIVDQAVFLRLS